MCKLIQINTRIPNCIREFDKLCKYANVFLEILNVIMSFISVLKYANVNLSRGKFPRIIV